MRNWLPVWLLASCLITLPAYSAQPLSAVSYNIRFNNPGDGPDAWPNRGDAVADYLSDFDVVGLQEVTFGQLEDLRQQLPQFEVYSVGRTDGEKAGEHSSILYRRDRLEATRSGTFWLSETPDQAGSQGWDAALPRICSWVVLRDKQTDRQFLFANTHFDHRGSQARTESGKLLRERASELPPELPLVLTGDFNCLPDSAPYQAITDASAAGPPFVDARKVSEKDPSGPNSTWCGFKEIADGRIIDHIFVRGSIEVLQLQVENPKTAEGRFASDHLPVKMIFRLGEPREQNATQPVASPQP